MLTLLHHYDPLDDQTVTSQFLWRFLIRPSSVFPLCATPHPLCHVCFLSWTVCLQYECGHLLQFLLAAVEFGVSNSSTAFNVDHTFWNLEYFPSLQDLGTFRHIRVALKMIVCLFVRHIYRYSYIFYHPQEHTVKIREVHAQPSGLQDHSCRLVMAPASFSCTCGRRVGCGPSVVSWSQPAAFCLWFSDFSDFSHNWC